MTLRIILRKLTKWGLFSWRLHNTGNQNLLLLKQRGKYVVSEETFIYWCVKRSRTVSLTLFLITWNCENLSVIISFSAWAFFATTSFLWNSGSSRTEVAHLCSGMGCRNNAVTCNKDTNKFRILTFSSSFSSSDYYCRGPRMFTI